MARIRLTSQFLGQLDANDNSIINVVDPSDPQDVATMNYVDTQIAGIMTGTDLTGNVVIGTASSNTLTVNSTSTFVAGTVFQGDVQVGSDTTDTLTVTGAANFNHSVRIGDGTTDSLIVNAAADFNHTVNLDGPVTIGLSTSPLESHTLHGILVLSGANARTPGSNAVLHRTSDGQVHTGTPPNATPGLAVSNAGYMSGADKQKLDNIGASGTVSHLEGNYPFPLQASTENQTFTLNYHLSEAVSLVQINWAGEILLTTPDTGLTTAGDHTVTVTIEDIDSSTIARNAPNSRPQLVYILNNVSHRQTIAQSSTDSNTTYDLATEASVSNGRIQLQGSDSTTDTVVIVGGTGVDVSSDAGGTITVNSHAAGGSDAQISISGVDGINTTDNIIIPETTYQYASVTAGDGTTSVTFSASGVEVPTNAFQENVGVAVIPTTSTPATQTFTQDDITESEEILTGTIPALTSGTNPFRTTITLAHNLLNGDFNQVAQIGSRNRGCNSNTSS